MTKVNKRFNLIWIIGLIVLVSTIIWLEVFGCKKNKPEDGLWKYPPMTEVEREESIPKTEIEEFKRRNKFYTSGLHDAITSGNQENVRKLLEEDTTLIWENGFDGESALILAVKRKDLSMVKLLLSIESSLAKSDRDHAGLTPLHWAVRTNNKEIAEVLLQNNARMNEEDIFDNTPLALAQATGNKTMIDFLKSKGATEQDFEEMIVNAASYGDYDSLKRLLDDGINVNTRVPNGCCLIHFAAESGKIDVVQLLLDRGANINDVAPDSHLTPLHNAASSGHLEMVKFLISKGADCNLTHYTGRTPAQMARESEHPEIAEYIDGINIPKK